MNFLQKLRLQNVLRRDHWFGESEWNHVDWSNAMNGEAGEAANIIKKIRRRESSSVVQGTKTIEDLVEDLADEIADTIIYADLLAAHFDIDLQAAIVRKFNRVSEVNNFAERL